MPTLLRNYLIITGVLAAIALAVPGLAVFGFFFFILPGLALSLAPTGFVWGVFFALAYLPARKLFATQASLLISLASTGLVTLAIPMIAAIPSGEIVSQYRLADVTPAAPILPQGDIRLVPPEAIRDQVNEEKLGFLPYFCDDQCLALLFEPGVRSVTMTALEAPTHEEIQEGRSRLDGSSLTYRLLPKSRCGTRALDPDLGRRYGNFGLGWGSNTALLAEWGLKLTEQYCVVGDPPIDHFDLLIRSGTWRSQTASYYKEAAWKAYDRETRAKFQDILDSDGNVLFRRFDLETETLFAPLYINLLLAGGGSLEGYFGWGSRTISITGDRDGKAAEQNLGTALTVQLSSDPQNGLTAARRALDSVVATAGVKADDSVLPLIEDYLQLLPVTEVAGEDVALIAALLADERISDIPGAWSLTRKLSHDQLASLLPSVIHKLATAASSTSFESVLDEQLRNWPKGSLTTPSAEMVDLLDDTDRRLRATGLVARLSDMGEAGPPVLADIMTRHAAEMGRLEQDEHASQFEKQMQANSAMIQAGLQAMCRLGSVAAAQLPAMQAVQQQVRPRGHSIPDWDRTLLRLGKPLTQMETPYSNSSEDYREDLSLWLTRYDEHSCDSIEW